MKALTAGGWMKSFIVGGVFGVVLTVALTTSLGVSFVPSFILGSLGMPCRYDAPLVEAGTTRNGALPIASQTGRTAQFENATVKVWKTVVAPGSPTAMHRHDHPRIVVAMTDGTMAFIGSDGKREEARWEAGRAYWLPAMPPGTMHSDLNAGEEPLAVMVVELEKE